MAIVIPKSGVFLHIPKTGGYFIETFFEETNLTIRKIGYRHTDLNDVYRAKYVNRLPVGNPEPYFFCFVRHPLSWYESWFNYQNGTDHVRPQKWRYWGLKQMKNGQIKRIKHACAPLDGIGRRGIDFDTYIKRIIKRAPGFLTNLYKKYTRYPTFFVGRTESLVRDLEVILQSLGIKYDSNYLHKKPHTNVSKKVPIIWNENLKQQVLNNEVWILDKFGYDANPPSNT